jgi:hypothetical protein
MNGGPAADIPALFRRYSPVVSRLFSGFWCEGSPLIPHVARRATADGGAPVVARSAEFEPDPHRSSGGFKGAYPSLPDAVACAMQRLVAAAAGENWDMSEFGKFGWASPRQADRDELQRGVGQKSAGWLGFGTMLEMAHVTLPHLLSRAGGSVTTFVGPTRKSSQVVRVEAQPSPRAPPQRS